ncbi:MAG: phosphoethanolamine transferase [Bdellovibrionales bacterium GWA2_49_15]|nr:MAG: phosphoethanolamine transferase [Bdellovibrionales bacterium GWA2_49_15]HAZ14696.1 phosphoethanolamine transferase [Bdellovibrionales bacterium]
MRDKFSSVTQTETILFFSIFLVLLHNITFFKKVIETYVQSPNGWLYVFSVAIVLSSVINLLFTFVRSKNTTKPILIIVLLLSSMTGYFIDHYGIVLDEIMLINVTKTNSAEALELFNFQFVMYFILLGLLPSFIIYKIKIVDTSFKAEVLSKVKNIIASLFIIFGMLVLSGKFYASFFRENKPLRYYTNPTYFFYSTGKYLSMWIKEGNTAMAHVGEDAAISPLDVDRDLIILVIGETARGDRFSLNGYSRETNPLLKNEDVVSFSNFSSCGTSTAISVPCMFSQFGRKNYNDKKGKITENLLDILSHSKKVNILWRDNNSDSKGVASRMQYEDYQSRERNTICDVECRDEGMLVGLQEYIDKQVDGDILIILHQMGNHGPAYYKRYPGEFERFQPVCRTNQLEKCSTEEISNAYDNAILYTDYFLAKTIAFLKPNTKKFETAMFYVSDHGESLGEGGLYLHGLPYFMAPSEQKMVGAVLWVDNRIMARNHTSYPMLMKKSSLPYSHDNIFHTILGLFQVETSIYNNKLDILSEQ